MIGLLVTSSLQVWWCHDTVGDYHLWLLCDPIWHSDYGISSSSLFMLLLELPVGYYYNLNHCDIGVSVMTEKSLGDKFLHSLIKCHWTELPSASTYAGMGRPWLGLTSCSFIGTTKEGRLCVCATLIRYTMIVLWAQVKLFANVPVWDSLVGHDGGRC